MGLGAPTRLNQPVSTMQWAQSAPSDANPFKGTVPASNRAGALVESIPIGGEPGEGDAYTVYYSFL